MKFKKWVAATDSHGDMQDDPSCKAVLEFNKIYKPDIRVHLGDAFDFRNLRKGASDEERAESLEEDWAHGTEFLRRFFDGGKENHFLRGNHDERIYDFRKNNDGRLRDHAADGIKRLEKLVRKCNAKMLPYDAALGVLQMGDLRMIHGYHAGMTACRSHANIYGNCLFGHVHSIESSPVSSLQPEEACSIGCLCIRDMPYINRSTAKLRWANGWAYGLLFEDGTYVKNQARKINGSFYVASEFTKL